MRLAAPRKAKSIAIPAFIMQAELDKSVVAKAAYQVYESLTISDKKWKTYPGYAHDSEFEHDRSLLDIYIASWIQQHSTTASRIS